MKEIWKDIEGYEGLYQVSNFGNIKSLYFKKEKLLKFITTQQGYLRVMLYKNKKRFDKYVAILVAQAFLPNLLNLETVNHKDGNKSDNSVNNLEWLSQEDNHKHWATKLNCKGHYQKKLNKNQVLKIRKLFNSVSYKVLGKMFSVCPTYIYRIASGKSRQYI